MLAPIILFVYNRLDHTKLTIQALQKNLLAKESELFIYSDGYKDKKSQQEVNEVREYLQTINGFKKTSIILRDSNWGLSNNIINGITNTVNQFGKVIVLEDDIVTNPFFLNFMNDALNAYENNKRVWHISGWNYPISSENLSDVFLWRTMNCWGWATWKDRWDKYEKNPQKLIATFSQKEINEFNLNGAVNFWEQVLKNNNNEMNTWAIFWYTTIFKNAGLCLNPTQSFVNNIGFDGTGTNTGIRDNYSNDLYRKNYSITFEDNVTENKTATDRIKLFYRENNEENKNLSFSKNLNKIFNRLLYLKSSSDKYILYGSGTGMDLVSNFLGDNIEFVIDNDLKKHNTYKNGLVIISLPYFRDYDKNLKIIITVFGRSLEIIETLTNQYKISKDRIISLDIFND